MLLAKRNSDPKIEYPEIFGVIHTRSLDIQPLRPEVFKYTNMILYLANGGNLEDFKKNDPQFINKTIN